MDISCQGDQRRELVRQHTLNGLDYLEVSDNQLELTVYFLGKLPAPLRKASDTLKTHVRIEGGRRIRDIRVTDCVPQPCDDPEVDDTMIVRVDKVGDFSTYTLRLVGVAGIDPRFDHVDFTFKAGCPSDLDCLPITICPPASWEQTEINYLAKDYATFRQLILDRLALIMPEWKERHIPDIGIMLVELLAYTGDYLSYYQDAVATEAYLDTARQRISVRRHARLVDYHMHEGCNARAWVCITLHTESTAPQPLPLGELYFITALNKALPTNQSVLRADDISNVPMSVYEVFEPIIAKQGEEDAPQVFYLHASHNTIPFYTWGEMECCLPRGATSATLLDAWLYTGELLAVPPALDPTKLRRALQLKAGDVLIFEEVISPTTGEAADADPSHRHAVRLTRVEKSEDPLVSKQVTVGKASFPLPQPLVEIEWSILDALPFALCISTKGAAPLCSPIDAISVARGNVILVDHGRTIPAEDIGQVPPSRAPTQCNCEDCTSEEVVNTSRFRPMLTGSPLTFSQPYDDEHPQDAQWPPATQSLVQDVRAALPQIWLEESQSVEYRSLSSRQWQPQTDLFGSHADDQHFVVEIDNPGKAHLRFGDGQLGRQPDANTHFKARYRVGNGNSGNVGAEAISHMVLRSTSLSGINMSIRNPLPAQGGTDAEPIVEVKRMAPTSFRKQLERAITADDYARLAERNPQRTAEPHPKVQRAAANLVWTGSWYEAKVVVDARGTDKTDATLLDEITRHLHRYRRAGHDLGVKAAHYVSLDIAMTICVLPQYLRGHVKATLQSIFSNRMLPDGSLGFFHPDRLTFGQSIYLSQLVTVAQSVTGVQSVQVTRLQRQFAMANHEICNGVLMLGPTEVARLDNDPNFPEHGKLEFVMKGGR